MGGLEAKQFVPVQLGRDRSAFGSSGGGGENEGAVHHAASLEKALWRGKRGKRRDSYFWGPLE